MSYTASRATGHFPLSVATSVALEAFFGFKTTEDGGRTPTNDITAKTYQNLYVNLRTMFRNLFGSLEKGAEGAVSVGELVQALREEVEAIRYVTNIYAPHLTVQFYFCKHTRLARLYPNASLRVATTPKQLLYDNLQQQTLASLLVVMHDEALPVTVFKDQLDKGLPGNTVILTHCAIDLLSAHSFGNLTLLESHTGALKTKAQWYTKLYNGKDLTRLPFNAFTLQVFGDGEHFRPSGAKLKSEVLELARRYRWNPITTRDKILYGITTVSDTDIKAKLLALMA